MKSKYEEYVLSKFTLIEGWVRDGLTDKQIAHNLGIAYSTFKEYKSKYADLAALLKRNKEIVDYEVENALLERARGKTVTLMRPFKVKNKFFDNGHLVEEKESIVYAEYQEYIPPDTTAQIFWLKNRKPDKWKDKPTEQAKTDTSLMASLLAVLNEKGDEDAND